jgi:isoquinoline 1-oxidoreductase subunit beta
VAEEAARLTPPAKVALKERKDWTLIGTPQPRFDVPDKVQGKPIYGIDVRVPGMLYAAIVHCPVFTGTVRTLDSAKAAAMPGVRKIMTLPHAVAVVADGWWLANNAAQALDITWDEGKDGDLSSESVDAMLQEALHIPNAEVARREGDPISELRHATIRIEAEYSVPFLAHATMEPPNCTAHVTDDRVEVWAPTQDAELALSTAAETAGVPRSHAILHRTMLGGGFGRTGPVQDVVREAVLIAKEVGRPVQLIWSREQDLRHDFYRPPAQARLEAGLDADGTPVAWSIRVAGQSLMIAFAPELAGIEIEPVFLEAFVETWPYDVPNRLVEYAVRNTHVPIGALRGIYQGPNAFFRECFIDEMAFAARQDPYVFRRKLCAKKPRYVAALDAAAAAAGWQTSAPPGVFRGMAVNKSANTICAQVAEVSISDRGELHVHRFVTAIDPGLAVNPRTIEEQVQGAVAFGLTAALYGDITIRNGRVEQSNFHDYEILRMAEMPPVETVILQSGGAFGGVGEQALAPVAPALCNAVFAATGRRVRSLPLKGKDLRTRAAKAG